MQSLGWVGGPRSEANRQERSDAGNGCRAWDGLEVDDLPAPTTKDAKVEVGAELGMGWRCGWGREHGPSLTGRGRCRAWDGLEAWREIGVALRRRRVEVGAELGMGWRRDVIVAPGESRESRSVQSLGWAGGNTGRRKQEWAGSNNSCGTLKTDAVFGMDRR